MVVQGGAGQETDPVHYGLQGRAQVHAHTLVDAQAGLAEAEETRSCRFRSPGRRAVVFQRFAYLKALENQASIGLKRA